MCGFERVPARARGAREHRARGRHGWMRSRRPRTRKTRVPGARARPERVVGMPILSAGVFCVANRVYPIVLRVLVTLVQRAWPKGAEDKRWLRDKFAVANLGQKLGSRVIVLATTSLSPGLGVRRTTDMQNLGSNKLVCRASPLQMAHCGCRCLYYGVSCT